MQELTVRQARELLTGWATEPRTVAGGRDDVVRAAVGTDPSKAELRRLTGVSWTTTDRVAGVRGLAMTRNARPCVAIACPYAEPVYGISGQDRHNAGPFRSV